MIINKLFGQYVAMFRKTRFVAYGKTRIEAINNCLNNKHYNGELY